MEVVYVADFTWNRKIKDNRDHKITVSVKPTANQTYRQILSEAFDGRSGIFEKMLVYVK